MPQLEYRASAVTLTSLTALVPSVVLLVSRFKQDPERRRRRFLWQLLPLDLVSLLVQVDRLESCEPEFHLLEVF